MGKIIAIWGSSGSGKSTLASILAKRLTRSKQKAIIISPDTSTPMLPVFLPGETISSTMSLGNVLSSISIDAALVASKVSLLKSYPFIGVMGYTSGENPLSYPEIDYDKVKTLITVSSQLVDYVILDCVSSLVTFFTPAAIEMADLVVRVLTPDLKGLSYFNAHQSLLADPRFRLADHLSFAGMARPFHAMDEISHLTGGFTGYLPYNKEIERCGTGGEWFRAGQYAGKKYMTAVERIAEVLNVNEQQLE